MAPTTQKPTQRIVLNRSATLVRVLGFACLSFFLRPVLAQQTQVAGKGTDTSMIHALGASGPNAALGDQSELFNRFAGSWDFDCTALLDDGKTTQFRGQWIFGWILDGNAMQDVWIGHENNDKPKDRSLGTTLRFYDHTSKDWRVLFVVPESGKVLQLRGGAISDSIVLVGTDVDGSRIRWSFKDIKPGSFFWSGETSSDNGKTWKVEQTMKLTRSAGRRRQAG